MQSFSDDFELALKKKLETVTSQGRDEVADLDAQSQQLAREIADKNALLTEVQRKRATIVGDQQTNIDHLNDKSSETRDAIRVLADELTTERDKVSRFIS